VDLLQQIDIDLEELLSKYTGDIIAHQLGKLSKNLKKTNDNPLETLKDELATLLIAPSKSGLFKNKET
jgi:ubiquinone biosynthesis protein UbiJ